jgi:hypothetical protein
VLIIADYADVTPEVTRRLKAFVAGGGKLLVSHQALLDENTGAFALADELGIDYQGPADSNPDYFQIVASDLQGDVTRPSFPYSLYDGPTCRVATRSGTEVLADAYKTYFNRTGEHFSSHGFTPPLTEKADYPAITQKGSCIYIYGPIFGAYHRYGNLTFRELVGHCLNRLLPDRIIVTDAPASTEVSLLYQANEGRYIVHLVNYSPQRRSPGHVETLEKPIPLHDISVALQVKKTTERVYLAPSGVALPSSVSSGAVTVTVPRIDSHAVVVFETQRE